MQGNQQNQEQAPSKSIFGVNPNANFTFPSATANTTPGFLSSSNNNQPFTFPNKNNAANSQND